MANESRKGRGAPNSEGGEFAPRARDAASIALLADGPLAVSEFDRLAAVIRDMEMRAIADDIRDHTRGMFPTATAVAFKRDVFGNWDFNHVIGKEGPLSSPDGKFNDEQPETYRLDDRVSPLARRFRTTEDPIRSGVVGDDLVMRFDIRPTVAEARVRNRDIVYAHQLASQGRSRARAELAGAFIRVEWSDASTIVLDHEEVYGRPGLTVREVLDSNGDRLWAAGRDAIACPAAGIVEELRPSEMHVPAEPDGHFRVAI